MEERGKDLASKALRLWPPLTADTNAVKKAEIEERKAMAAKYTMDSSGMDTTSKALFAKLRPHLFALGTDVVELFGNKSITYRVYDFFLEIIPRKQRLSLLLNLDYEECDDPSKLARDATNYAFIVNARENGGVVFSLKETTTIPEALHLIRQAYEKISE